MWGNVLLVTHHLVLLLWQSLKRLACILFHENLQTHETIISWVFKDSEQVWLIAVCDLLRAVRDTMKLHNTAVKKLYSWDLNPHYHLPCKRHFPMHWPTSTLVSNLVSLKKTCWLEIRWQSLSRGTHVQLTALVTSRTPVNVLIVVTSDSEAMQRSVPGQTSWQD